MPRLPRGPRPAPAGGLVVLVKRTVWWYYYHRSGGLVLLRIARAVEERRSAKTLYIRASEVLYSARSPFRWPRLAIDPARRAYRVCNWVPTPGGVVGCFVLV